ncbi:hypothetical protein PILCRDRAFT_816636 [Piloderma croceum F 1598]|uniref:Uncharacterized protein n=1 Tax=Piloderma croceum (strain F 1598) TaxID=765440 RepID=A0A0C3G645_PILCF|nr:hypothetical protein PILCRDRAFT_816636 [Piloderma croceum F 1598]
MGKSASYHVNGLLGRTTAVGRVLCFRVFGFIFVIEDSAAICAVHPIHFVSENIMPPGFLICVYLNQ